MKTTLGKLANAIPALNKISKTDLPIKDSCKLARFIKKVNAENEIYENERIKLCKKYGELNETTDIYIFEDKERDIFAKSMLELMGQEVEIDFEPFSLPDSISLTAADILAIEDFFRFDFEGKEE